MKTMRITEDEFRKEFENLVSLIAADLRGDYDQATELALSPCILRGDVSPAEFLRRGFRDLALEAARDNFQRAFKREMRTILPAQKPKNKSLQKK